MQNKKFIPRIHPATDNGKIDGRAVFLTQAELEDKRKELDNDWIFSCQLLLNPLALDNISFNMDWIKYYDVIPNECPSATGFPTYNDWDRSDYIPVTPRQ